MKVIAVLAVAVTACMLGVDARKNWALLIAGSAGYDNYRHQADICHAYQILHKAGIPDEQIVVMMYDDIAENTENPYKGNIINKPDGPNVYRGVLKDYTGKEVNANTFLAVLQGDKKQVRNLLGRDGKGINSGPDDYVFVNFADHGGPGILGMPNPPYLKARALNEALKKMHTQKKFAKLVFYVEACESGSIFENLLSKDINTYVTTSANPTESSYACYLDEKRQTYMGDVYSVKWMEDTDASDIHTETLKEQFKKVKEETNTSHVQQYGNLSFDTFALDKFFGENKQAKAIKDVFTLTPSRSVIKDAIPNDVVYDLTLKELNSIENWDCYETAVDTLLAFCPGLDITTNDFALRKFYALVNLCNNNPQDQIIRAVEAASIVNPLCHA